MQIEEGKFYITQNGAEIGPMKRSVHGWFYAVRKIGCWLLDGTAQDNTTANLYGNLIKEKKK